MNIPVRLFAGAKQAAGSDRIELELPEGATIKELRDRLAQETPELMPLLRHAMFAVGTEYAADTHILAPNTEIACIPPVSGG